MNPVVSFNNLPRELQLEILQESPTFIRLNKNMNTSMDSKQLFQSSYCDIEISKNEIIKYASISPPAMIIYGISKQFYEINMFYKKKDDSYDMIQYLYTLLDNNIEVGQLVLNNVNIINYVDKMYNTYDIIWLDVNTVYDIVYVRKNCNVNDIPMKYTKKYIDDIFNFNIDGNEKYYLFTKIIVSSYMESTYITLTNEEILYICRIIRCHLN